MRTAEGVFFLSLFFMLCKFVDAIPLQNDAFRSSSSSSNFSPPSNLHSLKLTLNLSTTADTPSPGATSLNRTASLPAFAEILDISLPLNSSIRINKFSQSSSSTQSSGCSLKKQSTTSNSTSSHHSTTSTVIRQPTDEGVRGNQSSKSTSSSASSEQFQSSQSVATSDQFQHSTQTNQSSNVVIIFGRNANLDNTTKSYTDSTATTAKSFNDCADSHKLDELERLPQASTSSQQTQDSDTDETAEKKQSAITALQSNNKTSTTIAQSKQSAEKPIQVSTTSTLSSPTNDLAVSESADETFRKASIAVRRAYQQSTSRTIEPKQSTDAATQQPFTPLASSSTQSQHKNSTLEQRTDVMAQISSAHLSQADTNASDSTTDTVGSTVRLETLNATKLSEDSYSAVSVVSLERTEESLFESTTPSIDGTIDGTFDASKILAIQKDLSESKIGESKQTFATTTDATINRFTNLAKEREQGSPGHRNSGPEPSALVGSANERIAIISSSMTDATSSKSTIEGLKTFDIDIDSSATSDSNRGHRETYVKKPPPPAPPAPTAPPSPAAPPAPAPPSPAPPSPSQTESKPSHSVITTAQNDSDDLSFASHEDQLRLLQHMQHMQQEEQEQLRSQLPLYPLSEELLVQESLLERIVGQQSIDEEPLYPTFSVDHNDYFEA